jgi:hypothetical protein
MFYQTTFEIKFSINDGNKFQGSGIYQLICGDCGKKHTGQKVRNFEKKNINITYTNIGVKTQILNLLDTFYRTAMLFEKWFTYW